jgi:tubulin polyglutamylase TTLL2
MFPFQKLSELSYDSNTIVQRYIEKPLLIGGYKFDLRLYVCIPSYHPVTIYIYREGLARFGTDKFSLNDLRNPFRHLTNSSINKLGPGYTEMKDRIGSGEVVASN